MHLTLSPLPLGRLALTTLVCVLALPAQAQRATRTANPPAAAPGQVWKLHREEKVENVTDPGTQQNVHMKIMSMLEPDGWKLDVRPGPAGVDCAYNNGRLYVRTSSPDDSTGVVVFPLPATFYSTSRQATQQRMAMTQQWKTFPCKIAQPTTLNAGLHMAVPEFIQNAQIVGDLQPVPGLSETLQQTVASANQQLGGSGAHITAEAGRLRVTGTFNGKQADMWLIAMQTQRTEQAPGGVTTITDVPMFAIVYAPPGKLDANDRLLMTVLSSIQPDPQWTTFLQQNTTKMLSIVANANATVARIHQQMAQDNANAAAQQAQIRAGAANYASQVRSSVAHNRAAALDHSSQQFALYMGDQAIYKDPSTGQHVQLSSGYDHVWASNTGNTNSYILTDSPSYNPNGNAGSAGWTQMQMEH